MLDHIGVTVSDLAKSKAFYQAALAPLGYEVMMDFGDAVGMGQERPDFWIAKGTAGTRSHIAFAAANRMMVRAFHQAAMAAGGIENGAPGLRPQYHQDYYGAFVLDPDGNNIEAVCRRPE